MSESWITPPAREPSPLRLVLTLAAAGLVAGLALAGAYEITAPRIAANRAREMREAVFEVVPGATAIRAFLRRGGQLVPSEGEVTGNEDAFAGFDDGGRLLGYAVPGEGPGFQDTIRLIFGYDPARRRVLGMQVLESRETPGLGDRIYKDPDFRANFADLAVDPEIVLVREGERSAPNEVNGITGATISSRAVVRILNAALQEWRPLLSAPEASSRGGGP